MPHDVCPGGRAQRISEANPIAVFSLTAEIQAYRSPSQIVSTCGNSIEVIHLENLKAVAPTDSRHPHTNRWKGHWALGDHRRTTNRRASTPDFDRFAENFSILYWVKQRPISHYLTEDRCDAAVDGR
jgi:hypothetical protein